jgi:hypothetical protein
MAALKEMMGALAPFSFLVYNKRLVDMTRSGL